MTDAIDTLCKECGFDSVLSKKRTEAISMVRFIIRTYEVFYGDSAPPPVDVVKKVLRVLLEFSPESINVLLDKGPEVHDKVLDRVVEKIYKMAEAELVKEGAIRYIA